jgi:hypothetical protein
MSRAHGWIGRRVGPERPPVWLVDCSFGPAGYPRGGRRGGLHPTGGAAILEIAQWMLAAAVAQGPGTALHARLDPEVVAVRRAA